MIRTIVLSDDIVIEGVVNWNIDCSGNVVIKGKINGNIYGNNIEICKAEINGNIDAKSNLNLSDCSIVGNIIAENIVINGHIEGNIETRELCTICENAVISGDISAVALVVKKHSRINGKINMIN